MSIAMTPPTPSEFPPHSTTNSVIPQSSSLKRSCSEMGSSCSLSYNGSNNDGNNTGGAVGFKSLERTLSTNSCNSSGSSRASPLLLDCHSLQSSLKRVRLSCSPGELRLQRDLRNLVTEQGWNQVGEHCWNLEDVASLEQVTKQDPLRLLLLVRCGGVGGHGQSTGETTWKRCWITIPRMYPHRPPVISRIEDMPSDNGQPTTKDQTAPGWDSFTGNPFSRQHHLQLQNRSRPAVERIVIHEAPPNGQAPSVPCGSTVVYNHWSPIMRLGDLLSFVLNVLFEQDNTDGCEINNGMTEASLSNGCLPPDTVSRPSSAARRSDFSHRNTQYILSSSSSASSTSPTNTFFVEEHKMEDSISGVSDFHSNQPTDLNYFPPNRFDAGYGKYLDPLQPQQVSNPMDVS